MADALIPCPRCGGTGSPPPVGMNDGRMVYHYPCPVRMWAGKLPETFWRHLTGVFLGRAVRKGYLLGFMASGEGYNGEYPFGDKGVDPESDDEWCEARDKAIRAALSAREGDDGKGEGDE